MLENKKIRAVYSNGQLRLLEDAELQEGQEVVVEVPRKLPTLEERNAAWVAFRGSITPEDAQEIQKFVDENFGKIDEDLWK